MRLLHRVSLGAAALGLLAVCTSPAGALWYRRATVVLPAPTTTAYYVAPAPVPYPPPPPPPPPPVVLAPAPAAVVIRYRPTIFFPLRPRVYVTAPVPVFVGP